MATEGKSQSNTEDLVVLGKITSLYGVRGWVKVYSHTEPMDNILKYVPWTVKLNGRWITVEVEQGKRHSKSLVAKLVGCDDRDAASEYCGGEIYGDRNMLPALEEGDYYWHQLEKLNVVTESGVELGQVDHLLATGSNDVLVIKSTPQSVDERERMVPYLLDQVVKEVNLEQGTIRVDWDPEF
ncbi:MAG: ribosome maturation factor RimM [Halopseudomonas sp.]